MTNIHRRTLENKVAQTQDEDLILCLKYYERLEDQLRRFKIVDEKSVHNFVDCFNNYRDQVCYALERRPNSGQELIRSTMLEGFFEILFGHLLPTEPEKSKKIHIGKANVLSGFTFSPLSFGEMFNSVKFSAQMKDQDFVIGLKSSLGVGGTEGSVTNEIIVPAVIIECKTYIEKNMLETHENSCGNTKAVFPFCKYFLVAEYMKMKTGRPQLSKLDDIYILTQTKNSDRERRIKHNQDLVPFNKNLVYHLYCHVRSHLNATWWNANESYETGKLFT